MGASSVDRFRPPSSASFGRLCSGLPAVSARVPPRAPCLRRRRSAAVVDACFCTWYIPTFSYRRFSMPPGLRALSPLFLSLPPPVRTDSNAKCTLPRGCFVFLVTLPLLCAPRRSRSLSSLPGARSPAVRPFCRGLAQVVRVELRRSFVGRVELPRRRRTRSWRLSRGRSESKKRKREAPRRT